MKQFKFSVGIDVENINRFKNLDNKIITRVLTANEYEQFLKTEKELHPKFIATHWVLKEAVYKAISEFHKIFFLKIEFMKKNNKYICTNFKNVKVSIAYSGDFIFGFAVYIK
ncbi:MAG: 4'-phosphopantetheinyl transferase superfamily protein [Malacoplasma sp.]|nr:4'-phosphopantetheinyl transferase superfamily protein [Malacoplasma sp.]